MEKNPTTAKKILILGSGMMCEPLLFYMLKRSENYVTLGTNDIAQGKILINGKDRCSAIEIDVIKDAELLNKLMSEHDIVISFIPNTMHHYVAKACLDNGKHMVTSSYISPEMKKLDSLAKSKKLTFMNECGLDPGIDHMIAFKIIEEAKNQGRKVVSFQSWCGALPAPQYANNPFRYKFSWSPLGAIHALSNDAYQLIEGNNIKIPGEKLLDLAEPKSFHPCYNLEGYYNRDSLKYKQGYNLKDAETCIRGTLRYQGFSKVMQSLKNLGLFAQEEAKYDSWRELLTQRIKDKKAIQMISETRARYFSLNATEFLDLLTDLKAEKEFYFNLTLYALSFFDLKEISKTKGAINNQFKNIFSALSFLEFYNESNKISNPKSKLESLSSLLLAKLKMEADDKDIVYMHNEFVLKTIEGKMIKKSYDLLLESGVNNTKFSAISITVAYPAAIAAQMILDGKFNDHGVLIPSNPILYNYILKEVKD